MSGDRLCRTKRASFDEGELFIVGLSYVHLSVAGAGPLSTGKLHGPLRTRLGVAGYDPYVEARILNEPRRLN